MKKALLLFLFVAAAHIAFGQRLVKAEDDATGKLGYMNTKGEWAIAPVFDEIYSEFPANDSRDGYSVVKINGKWGTINKKGEFVSRPVFESQKNASWARDWIQQGSAVGKYTHPIEDPQTGLYGFVNILGNWTIPPRYDDFYNSELGIWGGIHRNFCTVKTNGKWGCINRKGEFVIAPIFKEAIDAHEAGYAWENSSDFMEVRPSQVANITPEELQSMKAGQSGTGEAGVQAGQTVASAAPQPQALPLQQATAGGNTTPPVLTVKNPKGTYNTNEYIVDYDAKTFDGSTPKILVTINGKPYDINTKGMQRGFNEPFVLPLPASGKSYVQLMARDGNGLLSEPVYLDLEYVGDRIKPALHVLSIGISDYADPAIGNLLFGAKDAEDFARAIGGSASEMYRKINTPVVLTNGDATAIKIKTELNNLTRGVSQDDVVMLFFSGHGADENGDKYFLSSDAVMDNLYSTAVNFDDIQRVMRILKDKLCKVIIFVDACHSGALYGTKDIENKVYEVPPGIIGFFSSTNDQKSLEKKEWGNGIFTRALLDGMSGNAKDKNGNINTLDLGGYITKTVISETKNVQSPLIQNAVGDFILF